MIDGEGPPNKVQEQFSRMCLPIDRTSGFKVVKRLFRMIWWEGILHLLVTEVAVHESLAIFSHVCVLQGRIWYQR